MYHERYLASNSSVIFRKRSDRMCRSGPITFCSALLRGTHESVPSVDVPSLGVEQLVSDLCFYV